MTSVIVPSSVMPLDAVDQLQMADCFLTKKGLSQKETEDVLTLTEAKADFRSAQSIAVPNELNDGTLQLRQTFVDSSGEIIDSSILAQIPANVNGNTVAETVDSSTLSKDSLHRFVSPKDFDLLKVIGMGAFGKVLQVRNKHSSQIFAMKVISKRLLKRKSGCVENVLAERNILTKVRSPFVVSMHCSFQTREKLFIIMDFLEGGELFTRISREGIFLEKQAVFYLAEIILALDHLHSLGILHRDLKPENILLSSDGHICLTDFGLAKDFGGGAGSQAGDEDDMKRALTICGTHEYMAPEMIARKGYGRAADYWSLGCLAYEMLRGWPPFQRRRNESYKDLFRKIMTEKIKMPSGASGAACKLLKGLLNRNVQARLGTARSTMFEVGGVAGLKKAEFFQKINWDAIANRQVEPPISLTTSSDGELLNFHEDFTAMPLPRSVVEMSCERFRPHHVASDDFRGFSFIHDDFKLPERDKNELDEYWKAVEEEGESASESASSKHGDNRPPILQVTKVKKKQTAQKQKKK